MPHGPRLDEPGALHHVVARGIERACIFRRDRDRSDFLERLATVTVESAAGLLAWSLIPNHFHLLWRSAHVELSRAMQRLLGGHATVYNRRYRRAGHLFQNRFKSTLVDEHGYLLELVRYVHLNPLRAGLVKDLAALDQYQWSGHAVLMGERSYAAQDTESVLKLFGSDVHEARMTYRRFIADACSAKVSVDLTGAGLRRRPAGWSVHTPLARGRERWSFDERILGGEPFVEGVLSALPIAVPVVARAAMPNALPTLCARVAAKLGIAPDLIMSRSCMPAAVTGRCLVGHLAVTRYGMSQAEVARALQVSPAPCCGPLVWALPGWPRCAGLPKSFSDG